MLGQWSSKYESHGGVFSTENVINWMQSDIPKHERMKYNPHKDKMDIYKEANMWNDA